MTDQHVDREVLDALREVMEDSYPDLLDTFLTDSESRLHQLQKTADAKVLAEVAHSFKGSASNMGAVRLATLCQALEADARTKVPPKSSIWWRTSAANLPMCDLSTKTNASTPSRIESCRPALFASAGQNWPDTCNNPRQLYLRSQCSGDRVMPATPNVLLQSAAQAKAQAAAAKAPVMAADTGDKASSFAQVFADQGPKNRWRALTVR